MSDQATLDDFQKSIVEQHMPDDPLAQQALKLAIEMLMYSIWLAREHKKGTEEEKPFIIADV